MSTPQLRAHILRFWIVVFMGQRSPFDAPISMKEWRQKLAAFGPPSPAAIKRHLAWVRSASADDLDRLANLIETRNSEVAAETTRMFHAVPVGRPH